MSMAYRTDAFERFTPVDGADFAIEFYEDY
jgi:hypothetical protein